MKDQTRELCDPPQTTADVFGPWSCSAHRPGTIVHPEQLEDAAVEWLPAMVPCTVASALVAIRKWNFDAPPDLDAHDWWFRTRFARPELAGTNGNASSCVLCFDGLATLAEVWLNGEVIVTTDNMFRSYRFDIGPYLRDENELAIGFASLTEALKKKKPRPRWKTNLVAQQQLRWHRTTLLGRIPGWASVASAVGPWRDVRIECAPVVMDDVRLVTRVDGTTGVVEVEGSFRASAKPQAMWLRVGEDQNPLELSEVRGTIKGDITHFSGEAHLDDAPLWWPHTHGEPNLVSCEIGVETLDGDCIVHKAQVGFRTLNLPTSDGFEVRLNGESIYCRGACWTTSDLLSLNGDEASLRRDLQLARDAGVNMLRVGGTMTYESSRFYELCDELGIMVWQDFMFANMDYPVDDASFNDNITAEAREQLGRLSEHPSVVVYCGNSEIEQQVAMLGMPREMWTNAWFAERLPALVAELHPGTMYVPSTPTGGALPFHAREGVTHYYGIGAYLRPMSELRSAGVRFTSECLGFSNVPEPSTCVALFDGANPVTHDPRWKRRVPRDTGPGWDFEDVREHYLRELYGVDPAELRSFRMARYLQLSRVASGEMMAKAFAEWRSTHSDNRGGLVWFYKDLWPGAGWGVIDSTGLPKAAYYFLKRAWNSQQLTLTDEGTNGLDLHLTNETDEPCRGTLEVTLLKEPSTVVARQEIAVEVAGRGRQRHTIDEILGRFYDCNYAYRFGPPHHDVVIATWFDAERNVVSEATYFIQRREPAQAQHITVEAAAEWLDESTVQVTLRSNAFLHAVRFDVEGWLADDNYFHLPPERTKTVVFRPFAETPKNFRCTAEALNFEAGVSIACAAPSVETGGAR